ncbi:MAG: YihY/virulence factor BrkB family protein [Leptolyngbyaceae cyanobacterium bins.349]|nr:YihY/virulence factor BrkB family protein [Leptolyngbyaceae cyanobacterium bins.349]
MLQYIRSTLIPSKPVQLLIKTGLKWDQDNCPGMAASLSYFALFSLFPILMVVLSVVGWLLGPNTEAFAVIQKTAAQYVPPEVRDLIRGTLVSLNENSVGAGIIGFSLLLFAASAVFGVLRASVNRIWRSPSRVSEVGSPVKIVVFFVLNKLLAFVLVLGSAFLILASLLTNIAIKVILELFTYLQQWFSLARVDELELTRGLQTSSSFLILALTACLLYKILPAVRVAWQDVWLSALLTASLLLGLQLLVSNSVISIGGRFLSYGVIGSVMILMLWIFLTFQIFLFGCVLSYVYAYLYGSRRHHSLDQAENAPF